MSERDTGFDAGGVGLRRPTQQFRCGRQIVLDDAPVDGVIHVVEQVDVGEPDWVVTDLGGVFPISGLEVGRPFQPVDVGGCVQPFQELVADARRHQGVGVDVDPERLGFDQAVDANPLLAPPGRGG